MGRPALPDENRAVFTVGIRLTARDHAALRALAAQPGAPDASTLVRELIRREARARGFLPAEDGPAQVELPLAASTTAPAPPTPAATVAPSAPLPLPPDGYSLAWVELPAAAPGALALVARPSVVTPPAAEAPAVPERSANESVVDAAPLPPLPAADALRDHLEALLVAHDELQQKDVASGTGLSVQAVSKFRGGGFINDEKRARLWAWLAPRIRRVLQALLFSLHTVVQRVTETTDGAIDSPCTRAHSVAHANAPHLESSRRHPASRP
jgi:hypothetical protein